jgi:hypothetical protein
VFIVHNQNQYAASAEYHKKLESIGSRRDTSAMNDDELPKSSASALTTRKRTTLNSARNLRQQRSMNGVDAIDYVTVHLGGDSHEVDAELRTLEIKYDREREQNRIEFERSIGKEVMYGQAIQLMHLKSKKFLTITRESAELQKDCVRLTLDEQGNANSVFFVMPYYKFRTEGQKVIVNDQIRLWNRKSNQHIHLSDMQYDGKKREVNMSSNALNTKWRIRLFTGFIGPKFSSKFLKAGDVIRLYHQNADGYLDVDPEKSNTVKIRLDKDKDAKNSSNSMWEVELYDPSRGGILTWQNMYRFRHVATNRYLTVRLPMNSDSDDSDDDSDGSSEMNTTKTKFAVPRLQTKIKFATSSGSDNRDTLSPRHAPSRFPTLQKLEQKLSHSNQPQSSNPITSKWNVLRKKILPDRGTANTPQGPIVKTYDLFVDEPSASATLFTIHAPNNPSGNIALDSFLRIQHHHTKSWMHAVDSKGSGVTNNIIGSLLAVAQQQTEAAFLNKRRRLYETSYAKIETSTALSEEDVFMIKLVSQDHIDDLLVIQSAIASFDAFRAKLKKKHRISKADVHNISSTLQELCIFCTDSVVTDVMKREGIPFPNRQNYLREQLVLHKVMDIIRFMFVHQYIDINDLSDEKFIAERDMIKYAYRFIKQAVKQSKSNGLHMAPYIGFIQSQIEISGIGGINVSATLIEVLNSGNYQLLSNIHQEEVEFFVNLILNSEKRNPDHLSFLNAIMCTTNERAVVKNQDLIRQLLFDGSEKTKQKLLIPYMRQDKMYVAIDGAEEVLGQFVDYCNSTGSRAKYGVQYLEYFQNTIELMSRLCMGRNVTSIEFISKVMSLDLVMRCVGDNLPSILRSSFCNLLLNCYIDRIPYERKPLIKLTRSWHQSEQDKKTNKKKDALVMKMEDVKGFINRFFAANNKLDKQERELNSFILTLTKIARAMIEFRIFDNTEDIMVLLSHLFKLLDGRTDMSGRKLMSERERYVEDEQNSVVTAIKIEICKMFNLFIDISMNRKISFFVRAFKERASDDNFLINEPDHEKRDMIILDRLFVFDERNEKPSTIFDSEAFQQQIFKVLLDLQRYDNPELANSALNLLFRMHHQKEELSGLLLRLELLVSRQMVRSYNELNNNTSKLRQLVTGDSADRMQGAETQRLKELIDNIVNDAKQNGQRAQRIMRNLKAHRIATNTLKRTFYDPTTQSVVWQCCTKLLIEFVRNNPQNQQLLFRELEFFISRLNIPDMPFLLAEIVRHNRTLCTSIEERHVRNYIDTMAEQEGLSARYLSFLRSVVFPEGKPLKRNQNFVIKSLMERKKDVIVLFEDKQGIRDRNKRISKNEHINEPDGLLNYHIALLQLMCDCGEGKNHVAEVKLQSLLSIDAIIEQLTDSILIPSLRNPLTRFLNEVYINTERDSLKYAIQTNERLWRLFEKMNKELEYFMQSKPRTPATEPEQQIVVDPETTSPSASTVTVHVVPDHAVDLAQGFADAKIDNHYVYRLMIPLLREYFFKHYPPPNILEHHEKISQRIIMNLTTLYTKTANPNHREAIKRCAQAMYKKRMELKGSSRAIDGFFVKLMTDTSKPCEISRESRQKLDEKDEQLCNRFMANIKEFEPLLYSRSDMKNASLLYDEEATLKTLVLVLRRIKEEGYDQYTQFATVHALRTLQALVKNTLAKEDDQATKELQEKMVRVNCPLLIVDLVCCPIDIIVYEALNLGILLLDDGSEAVQKNLLTILINTNSEAFFIALKDRIRKAITEIKGRRDFLKKRLERLKALNDSNRVVNLAELRKRDAESVKKMQQEVDAKKGSDASNTQFIETGYIKKILRFLQSATEGHFSPMQEYLNNQIFNNVTVNLVKECLSYTLALEKYIDSYTIDIAIQCFDTMTEFIQGPCRANQMDIGTPNLFFAANEMLLSGTPLDISLPVLDVLKLRTKIMITLLSLLEGNHNDSVYLLMRSSLSAQILQDHALQSAAIRSGALDEALLIRVTKDWNHAYDNGLDCPKTPKEMLVKYKKRHEKFGLLCYFLLNTFRDKKIGESVESDISLAAWFKKHTKDLAKLQRDTGRIEIQRNGLLERVYFTRPELGNNLIEETKQFFLHHVDRESPQTKVYELLKETSTFRVELEHYEEFKIQESEKDTATLREHIDAALWTFVEKYWSRVQLIVFLYAIMMNIIVVCTFKRTYNPVAHPVPIPGFTVPSMPKSIELGADYSVKQVETTMFSLGLFQMILATFMFMVHAYFYSALKVKKLFNLKKTETWKDLPNDWEFVRKYIYFSLLERRLWYFIFYMGVCFIGWVVHPMVYSVLLIEVVINSSTLRNITKAISNNIFQLLLTGILMLFSVLFFAVLYFSYSHNTWYTIQGTQGHSQDLAVCDSVWTCVHGFIYWLRDEGFPEGGSLVPGYGADALRFFIDMAMVISVYIVMMEVVFGIVLDAFADLRQEREEKEAQIKNRCFICDIERTRFDTKANEGITFIDHIKNDHYMWNYVFFFIYLFKKRRTEFTGTEQYIYDLAVDNDTSFFPILRSLTLEESDLAKQKKEKMKLPPIDTKLLKKQAKKEKKNQKKKQQHTTELVEEDEFSPNSSPRSP